MTWDTLQKVALGALLAVYIARGIRVKRQSMASLLFMLISAGSLTFWRFYFRLAGSLASSLFFYAYNGQHCLSYLGLVHYMTSNKEIREGRPVSSVFSWKHVGVFMLALIFLSAALVGVVMAANHFSAQNEATFNAARLFPALEGFFVVHYYLESISWRYKDPHIQAVTFRLLEAV